MREPRKRRRWWLAVLLLIVAVPVALVSCQNTNRTLESIFNSVIGQILAPFVGRAHVTSMRGHIEQYKTMLLMYQGHNGFFPSTEQGLKALTTKPESEPLARAWRQLLDKPILDQWKQEFFYEQPGRHNPTSYDVFSAGPDRTPHTADDIGNWDAPQK